MRSYAGLATKIGAVALSACLVGGCALMKPASPTTGTALKGDADTFKLPDADASKVSEAKTAVTEFKKLNSTENFTMPIGNNFTMPIGNNFTMPIGNNLIGNVGAGYRIATTVSGKVLLGFAPVPAGSDFATTSTLATLPATGSAQTQDGTIKSSDSKFDATVKLSWWDDGCSTCQGYEDAVTYTTLTVPVNSVDQEVKGSYKLRISGSDTWPAPTDADKSKFGGLILLGQNANPATISRRQETFTIALKANDRQVADFLVDQTKFRPFDITIPKDSSQDARNVSIQVPEAVSVVGSLAPPTAGASMMGINLAATADYEKKIFTMAGWLKTCAAGATSCAATGASSQTGSADEIRESYTLDFSNARSELKFSKAASGTASGWRITLRYDYGVALVLGKPGGSLTGDMWLIDSAGNNVDGGKLADITSDDKGNPVLNYLDGTTETWKIN